MNGVSASGFQLPCGLGVRVNLQEGATFKMNLDGWGQQVSPEEEQGSCLEA